MAESSDLIGNIRAIMRLTTNVIDLCYDFRTVGLGTVTDPSEGLDIERTTDRLTEMRDVLENLFKAATVAGLHSPGLKLSLTDRVMGVLASCRSDIRQIETEMTQASGWKGARRPGPPSSSNKNWEVTLSNLSLSTTALRGLTEFDQRPPTARHSVPANNFIDSRNSNIFNANGDQKFIYNIAVSDDAERTRKDICQWLSAPDPSSNQNDALDKRGANTGVWFIGGEFYKEWKAGAHSFAWIHGIPGCGKSVLCSIVVEETSNFCEGNDSCALAYFYFDFNDPNKQQSAHLVRSLLTQLSFHFPQCPDPLAKLHSQCQHGSQQPKTEALLNALKAMLGCLRGAYIILDALDECTDQGNLIAVLARLASWKLDNLHILATSRRERYIENGLAHLVSSQMGLDSDLVDADIQIYLSTALRTDVRFQKWTAEEHHEIEHTVTRGANGMFRWVTCQLDALAKCSSIYHLRKALRSLPKTLEETYERNLSKINEEFRGHTQKLLRWLSFSARPLKLTEMAEILAIDGNEGVPRFDPDQRLREPRDILDICSSLIMVSDNYLRLAHLSVKEYLVSEQIKSSSVSYYYLSKRLADAFMAQECLAYLLHFDTVDCLHYKKSTSPPFGRYAAQFWIFHARSDDGMIQHDVQPLISAFFLSHNAVFPHWMPLDTPMGRKPSVLEIAPRPFFYACHLGLDQIVHQLLLKNGVAEIDETGILGSALAAASNGGHEVIVRALIDSGADVNAIGGYLGTALASASAWGHEEIVHLLLDNGADVNAVGGEYGSALGSASYEGHEGIVQILLDNGADVNSEGVFDCNALGSASHEGHEGIVRALLERGANVNSAGAYGGALVLASYGGHESIVRALLEGGADVNLKGGYYGNALGSASACGHERIVQLLLESGADVNMVGGECGSALGSASHEGHQGVVRILLDSGADVNLEGGFGCNALEQASHHGHEEVVRTLLERGANVNSVGAYGGVLASASYVGHEAIVRVLLEKGADVNLEGGYYGSALGSASACGHVETVRLLLESGADVNLVGGPYGSALSIASARGHEATVRLLLERGADVMFVGFYGSALITAVAEANSPLEGEDEVRRAHHREVIVRLLLENGADVNVKDRSGHSALYHANMKSHRTIAQLLLENGANPQDIEVDDEAEVEEGWGFGYAGEDEG